LPVIWITSLDYPFIWILNLRVSEQYVTVSLMCEILNLPDLIHTYSHSFQAKCSDL